METPLDHTNDIFHRHIIGGWSWNLTLLSHLQSPWVDPEGQVHGRGLDIVDNSNNQAFEEILAKVDVHRLRHGDDVTANVLRNGMWRQGGRGRQYCRGGAAGTSWLPIIFKSLKRSSESRERGLAQACIVYQPLSS